MQDESGTSELCGAEIAEPPAPRRGGLLAWLALLLIILVVALAWLGHAQRQEGRSLSSRLDQAQRALASNELVLRQTRQTAQALEAKVGQLIMVLTNQTAELSAARTQIRDLETRAPHPPDAIALAPKDEQTQRFVAACAPTVSVVSNATGGPSRLCLFKTLYGRNGEVLGRDLEYSAVYGRRVAFKEVISSRRLAFDVEELHPYVLAHLGINADGQKQYQARQDELWRRMEAAGLKSAAEEQSRREARKAAEDAARIEAEKLLAEQRQREHEQEMQRRAMENESLRAEAAMRSADAAMIRALTPPPNPPPIIINYDVNRKR